MDKNKSYFILGGVISFTLFFLLLLLFAVMMFSVKKDKIYGFKKDKFIAVSLVMPKDISKFTSQVAAPKSTTASKAQDIDVNDLFSNVWTQKISHKKKTKKVNSKRIEDIAKKIKTAEKNQVDSISKKLEKLEGKESDKNEQQASTGNEVNEYLAKIQAIVYQHFNVPPNSEGHSVKTVIELDALGRMTDFRILNYSANEALNAEVDKIKKRLKNVVFPKNPHNKSSRTVVVLISKE
jgi:protein TonB